MSRESILEAIKKNQPAYVDLPVIENYKQEVANIQEKYIAVLQSIGGTVHTVNKTDEIIAIIKEQFKEAKRIVSSLNEFSAIAEVQTQYDDPHQLEDVDLAIIKADFGVAENSAVWITEKTLPARALPFITQHLAVVLNSEDIVASMHDAYDKIANADYGFGVFIAGPSKTADIEQSLVLGAHGPKTMTVFILS